MLSHSFSTMDSGNGAMDGGNGGNGVTTGMDGGDSGINGDGRGGGDRTAATEAGPRPAPRPTSGGRRRQSGAWRWRMARP